MMNFNLKLLSFVAALLLVSPAYAQRITDLPAGTALTGTEIFPAVQSSATVRLTANQLQTFIASNFLADAVGEVTSTNFLDSDLLEVDLSAVDTPADGECLTYDSGTTGFEWTSCSVASGVIADGDYGDIVVSSSATVWDLDTDVVGEPELDLITADTPVDEDCLTYESGGGGGTLDFQACSTGQTPWVSNIDADSFSLLFDDSTGIKSSESANPELLLFTSVASAVNEITISNAATNTKPIIEATGSDANVGIWIKPKFDLSDPIVPVVVSAIAHTAVTAEFTRTPIFQVNGTASADSSSIIISRWAAGTGGPRLIFGKSRGTTIGTDYTIAQAGDDVGEIAFSVTDGVNMDQNAVKITAYVEGTPGADDMEGRLELTTGNADADNLAMTWDSNQRVIIGDSNASISADSGTNPALQVTGYTEEDNAVSISSFDNDATAGKVLFVKSRATTLNGFTIVQNNDLLGAIKWVAADGTDLSTPGAFINAVVDGTPGANDMPTRLQFGTTADGASTLTTRWVIDSRGRLTGPTAGVGLSTVDDTQIPALQLLGVDHNDSSPGFVRFSANAFAPVIHIGKSRGATVGTNTIVQASDQLGHIQFMGADGTDYNDAAGISVTVDGTPGTDVIPGAMTFTTTTDGGSGDGLGRWRISNGGRFVGPLADSPQAIFESSTFNPAIQVLGLDTNDSAIVLVRYSNDTGGPHLYFVKTRGTAVAAETIVQANDALGIISFSGADGNNSSDLAAEIKSQSAGTPGATGDMPGRIIISVSADGSGTPTDRFYVEQDGAVVIGDVDSGVAGIGMHMDDEAIAAWYEANANGDHFKAFVSAASNTASTTCTFENDAHFVPITCVDDGVDDTSDERLKENFKLKSEIEVGELLDQIKIYDFTWKTDADIAAKVIKGQPGVGPKAQELYEVAPQFVKKGGDDPLKEPWRFKAKEVIPYLIVEIQNLRKRITELEAHP